MYLDPQVRNEYANTGDGGRCLLTAVLGREPLVFAFQSETPLAFSALRRLRNGPIPMIP
jgi:hypothetical protein